MYGGNYLPETARAPANFDDPEPGAGLALLRAGLRMHLARHRIQQALAAETDAMPLPNRANLQPVHSTGQDIAGRAGRHGGLRLPSVIQSTAPRAAAKHDGAFANLAAMAAEVDDAGEELSPPTRPSRVTLTEPSEKWRAVVERSTKGDSEPDAASTENDTGVQPLPLPLLPKLNDIDQLMAFEAQTQRAFDHERARLKKRLDLRALQQFGMDFWEVSRERHTVVSLIAPKNALAQLCNDPMHLRDHQVRA
jgi:hypothetical protein